MKNADKFKSKLLETKKKAFQDAVRRCAKELGFAYAPKVSVTKTPCLMSSGSEIAHIHPEERIICIWKSRLETIDLDTIESVAAHEVAHLVSLLHDETHAQVQADLQAKTWHPPGGIVVIDRSEKESTRPPAKSRKRRARRKNVCSYYSCRRRTKLVKCPHCGRKFCPEHLNPIIPVAGIHPSRYTSEQMMEKRHPCPDYYVYIKQEEKKNLDKRWEALDRLKEIPRPVISEPAGPTKVPSEEVKSPRKTRRNIAATIVAIIVVVLILLFSFGLL